MTKSKSNLVEFETYTTEAAEEDEKLLSAGADFLKLKEGRTIVRFLPAPKGGKVFHVYWQHFIEKPDGSTASFACPNRPGRQPCPVCEYAQKLHNSGNAIDQKTAKKYWPRKRILANVIDRKGDTEKVYALGMPPSIYDKLIKIRKNEDFGGDFSHPMDGFDICIERKGTGMRDTEYTVIPSKKNSKLAKTVDEMNELIQSQTDLTAYTRVLGYDEIQGFLTIGESGHQRPESLKGSNSPQLEAGDDDFLEGDDLSF